MGNGLRAALLCLLAVALGAALVKHGPIPQPSTYHDFADTRTLLGIPNALNVLSNALFLVVGLLGLGFLRRGPTRDPDGPFRPGAHTAFESLRERPAYVLFFTGVLLTALGSGFYHLRPSTSRLFWDRLPMTIGFTALFAAMIAERASVYWSRMLLLPFVFGGVASVVLWRLSEESGQGDMRLYVFVQLFPMIALPVLMLLYPPRYSRAIELVVVIVVYAAAKALEHYDAQVWEHTQHVVSGHSLKHVIAALAAWLVLDMLKKRGRPAAAIQDVLAEEEISNP